MARVLRAACCVLRALHAFPTGKVVRGPTRTVVGMACMLACCVLRAGACCPPREGGWVPLRAFPVPCCCRTGMVAGLTTGMVDVAQMKSDHGMSIGRVARIEAGMAHGMAPGKVSSAGMRARSLGVAPPGWWLGL